MTSRLVKDVLLFRLSTAELRCLLDENSLVFLVWIRFLGDLAAADHRGRAVPDRQPLQVFHEAEGRGHVLRCRLSAWRYFEEIEGANPLERSVRGQLLSLGHSGEAERRLAQYAPSPVSSAAATAARPLKEGLRRPIRRR